MSAVRMGTSEPATNSVLPQHRGRVLPTLNEDGSRRWLTPKPSKGPYNTARLVVAWALIGLFTVIPYLSMGGQPLVLLDIVHRRFALFGTVFYATDTLLLMLFFVTIFAAIFLITALWGRVWCGWACPQTVYMEYVFRPLERLLLGSLHAQRERSPAARRFRRALQLTVYAALSFYLAHTFLAYFVGVDALATWVTGSPADHPVAFAVVAVTTGLMLFNFGVFREQTCLVACPYGRFQSVLLDRRSLIVGYDPNRGEPRGKVRAQEERVAAGQKAGDCIDCRACVVTCPTGIDIRDGLQMECIHCTQCIDACDEIMVQLGKPKGLVRYTSQDELAGAPRRSIRWRTVAYPALMLGALAGFVTLLATRATAEATVLRGIGAPWTRLPDGRISNQIRFKIRNRAASAQRYTIALADLPEGKLVAPVNPLPVNVGQTGETSVFVMLPEGGFLGGVREVRFVLSDGQGYETTLRYRLLGPGDEVKK